MTPTAEARRSRLAPVFVVVLIVVMLAMGSTAAVRRSRSVSRPSSAVADSPATTATPLQPTSTATTAPLADTGEPAYITKIKAQVSELRGLAWKAPLKVDVVPRDEVARRAQVANERYRRPDRMAGDGDTLKVLHLIPADLDYVKTVDDLLSGLILGFYDPTTKELVVGQTSTDNGGDVDGTTKVTLAHELDHALTDQWFDFGSKTQALDDADRQEAGSAFGALIEGDAKSIEPRFAEKFLSEEEQLSYALGSLGSGDTGAAAKVLSTPKFILDSLYFPYEAGLAFVDAVSGSGSGSDVYAGVDAAYRRPPTSTEQILHPDTYAAEQTGSPPALVDVAGATGCEARRRNTLGEFTMRELLDSELDTSTAEAAASGWNGDVFQTVRCGTSLGLVERWQTDTDVAAGRLARAVDDWGVRWAQSGPREAGRFSGPGGTGSVWRTGSVVTVVLGADAATADRLATAIG